MRVQEFPFTEMQCARIRDARRPLRHQFRLPIIASFLENHLLQIPERLRTACVCLVWRVRLRSLRSAALEPYASGPVHLSQDGRRLRAPVRSGGGLASTVVRALDAAGITVDDVEVHQPSLDDVFFPLTGRPAEMAEERDEPGLEVVRS
jgi:hypothetical protein